MTRTTRPQQLQLGREDFDYLRDRLRDLTGIFLSDQKQSFIQLRLRPRLDALEIESFADYRQMMAKLPSTDPEWQLMINHLTTNKTNFFREASHFDFLVKEFLPRWTKQAQDHQKLRVWSAVCSTGEEAYTIAMVLDKYFNGTDRFKVIASDVDTDALAYAKNGVYPKAQVSEIPSEYQKRSLGIGSGDVAGWFRINRRIHDSIQFVSHNLLSKQSSFAQAFDVIFCRNVFIYFRPETIQTITDNLYDAAGTNSALFLGHSESLQSVRSDWKYCSPSTFSKGTLFEKPVSKVVTKAPSPIKLAVVKPATPALRKKVLIVDDSPTITKLLAKILGDDPGLEVVATINHPRDVEAALKKFKPDVMTLDINMPEMDGCAVLENYMGRYPVPTVMISSISMEEGPKVLQALELGAVDYIQKPSFNEMKTVAPLIVEKVKDAVHAKVKVRRRSKPLDKNRPKTQVLMPASSKIIAIGSSTGGTEALREILTQLPSNIPPIVITQHIPPVFSNAFAMRLNDLCEFDVKEAKDGDILRNGLVLIAPGGIHMVLQPTSAGFIVRLEDTPAINRHKPSVDTLFDSVAKYVGRNAIGVILTGMGADGARGLLKMRQAGAKTLAQDEASSVVFGMPKEAIKMGAAEQVCSLEAIPEALLGLLGKKAKSA